MLPAEEIPASKFRTGSRSDAPSRSKPRYHKVFAVFGEKLATSRSTEALSTEKNSRLFEPPINTALRR